MEILGKGWKYWERGWGEDWDRGGRTGVRAKGVRYAVLWHILVV